jgi:hypothetical protein
MTVVWVIVAVGAIAGTMVSGIQLLNWILRRRGGRHDPG